MNAPRRWLAWLSIALITPSCRGDGGLVFSAIEPPIVSGAKEAADPAIGIDSATGDLLLAWVAGDTTGYHLYFARSGDEGESWSPPVQVTQQTRDVKPHAEASPRLLAGNGVIAVTWPNNIYVPGRRFPASHIRFARSTDGGRTWQQTITLNDDTTAALAGHTFHGATLVPPTKMVVAWLDSREGSHEHGEEMVHHDGDATIYTAVSNDLGATWDPANTKYWGDACPCCRVTLAHAKDGRIFAAWRGHFDGDVRDPVVAELSDASATPTRVSVDNWVLNACPHSGPALAIDDSGAQHLAWFTGKTGGTGVYYTKSSANAFGTPIPLLQADQMPAAHPAIAHTPQGALIAINVDEKGQRNLLLVRVRDDGTHTKLDVPDTQGADHPHLTRMDSSRVLVAWTEKGAAGGRIRLGMIR